MSFTGSNPTKTTRLHSTHLPVDSQYHGFETSSLTSSSRARSDLPFDGKGVTSATRRRPPFESSRFDLDQSRERSLHSQALASARQDDYGHDKPQLYHKKTPQPVDPYPTPPPSPDLLELDIVPTPPNVPSPLVSHEPTTPDTQDSINITGTDWDSTSIPPTGIESHSNTKQDTSHSAPSADPNTSNSRSIRYKRSLPAIPISLSLYTHHTLPHAAPFRLAHPAGILSALGGNRVLQVDRATSIFDRMPYSPASTNGLMLTQDQGEEASVEQMLEGHGSALRLSPMSPDQSYVFFLLTPLSPLS